MCCVCIFDSVGVVCGVCVCVVFVCFFVFFQAEDGIRDLVRSRGLGDVYKRQLWDGFAVFHFEKIAAGETRELNLDLRADVAGTFEAVSYTHLTLPTSDLV